MSKIVGIILVLLMLVGNLSGPIETVSAASGEEVITFPDENLEAAIREALGKPTGDITAADMAGLTNAGCQR